MDEYIKKESTIKSLLNDSPEQVWYSREDAADCIRYMDAADVAPVRHGRWVKQDDYSCCSGCGQSIADECVPWFKFCPNCGADMRGINDE